MKYAFLVLLLAFSPLAHAQPPKSKTGSASAKKAVSSPKRSVAASSTPKPKPTPRLSEKEQFDKASALELASDRVAALEKFLTDFPLSENRAAATELMSSSRVLIAEEKLLSGDVDGAVALLKRVVADAPQPIPNELFESISRIPTTLFFQGQRTAAIELATAIEGKSGSAAQLVEIANFYLSTENGSEAMRVAAKAAAIDPSSADVHRTIALAHRINFDIELSADEYAKSLEVDPTSVVSKRGLAEMKRALGKSDEAVVLYRDVLAKNENDLPARTGLVLALFDAGKRAEAEAEMARSLEKTPGNVILLAGAAYWYASKGLGDKAIELAEKAVAKEPRYVWSHIALARGYMAKGKPVEAEQVLVKARAYGNFPTLEYEIASARIAAGFFRDAAEDLQKQFSVTSTGTVKTNLGGRVTREENSLADLASFERKASIFTPASDSAENAEILKALLLLDEKLHSAAPNEAEVVAAAEAFTKGSDKMRIHRQLYAAALLLQKRVAIDKVLDLSKALTISSDSALDVPNPGAAVMASELYEPRTAAIRKNEFLLVPEVPAQTLSAILRGRIEEIAGWALFQQDNFAAAIIRLRRAKSVLPDKSAWWRSSVWRLGAALAANGNDAEALSAYIESYKTDKPDLAKYSIVEALYKKVNGSTDGLEEKLGRERVAAASTEPIAEPVSTPTPTIDAPASIAPITAAETTPVPIANAIKEASASETPKPVDENQKAVEQKTESEPKIEPQLKSDPPAPEKQEPKIEPVPTDLPKAAEAKSELAPKTEPPQRKDDPTGTAKPESSPEPPAPKTDPPQQKDEPPGKVKEEPKTELVPKPDPPQNSEATRVAEQKVQSAVDTEKQAPPGPDLPEPVPSKPATGNPSIDPARKSGTPRSTAAKTSQKTESAVAKPGEAKPLFEPIVIPLPVRKPKPATEASGAERSRLIESEEARSGGITPCAVSASQENISLINDGGTMGLLVGVEAPGDIKNLTAVSTSSKDIDVTLEPEIGGVSDRRFFIVKSISSVLGVYTITFDAVCGKKDVQVRVR